MAELEINQVNLLNALGPNIWDGKKKYFAKNCDGCRFNINVAGEDRCYHGVAYKSLVNISRLKKCTLLSEPSPREMELYRRKYSQVLYETQRQRIR